MAICCLYPSDSRLQWFHEVTSLSSSDVATLIEVFDLFLRNGSSYDIDTVLTRDGYFIFLLGGKGDFDFYGFINSLYTGKDKVVINCLNARKLFPRALSNGIFVEDDSLYEDSLDDDEEGATGFMDTEPEELSFHLVSQQYSICITSLPKLLGRSKNADFSIEGSNNVSRKHCKVYSEGSHVVVEDLDTPNGTFINHVRVRGKGILNVGDTLTLADVDFTLK